MANNENTSSVFQNITSDYTENVRRIMELSGSENMKLTNAINALNSRIAAMGQQAALRSIGLSEQLTNKRMQDLGLMAQAYRAHYEAFGGVLDDAALSFLDTHANIDAPTFTSIMAGYEHARASRAKNALAHLTAERSVANDQYEAGQRHLQNYMKSQEAMMSSELQNLKNQQNILLQQMKNNESMANALVKAEIAGLNARQRAEAAALRAGGVSGRGMPGINAAKYFTPLTQKQVKEAEANKIAEDYFKIYRQPIDKKVELPRMSSFRIEQQTKSDGSGTIVIPLYRDYELGDGIEEIAEENQDMSIKLLKERDKFAQSDIGKKFGEAAYGAFNWLVDYAKLSKDKTDIITQLSNGTYNYSTSKQLRELEKIFKKNSEKNPELASQKNPEYPNYNVYLPNVQLYIANELLPGVAANLDFTSVMNSNENVFFDQPDIDEAMRKMTEKGGTKLTSLFEVRNIADRIRTHDDMVGKQYDYENLMSELGESTQSSQGTQGTQQNDVILMDMIDAPESGRNYNIYNYRVPGSVANYRGVTTENLTGMTVAQIMQRGKKGREHFYAAGAHQIIPDTLKGVVKAGTINSGDYFNELTQDKAFAHIAKGAAGKYIMGQSDNIDDAGHELAVQWRVLKSPKTRRGVGRYDNATVEPERVIEGLQSARKRYQHAIEQNIDPEQSFHYAVTGKLYSDYQQ